MKKTGVSLIILVITIIVMAILAGIVIANLDEGDIVDDAEAIVDEANFKTIQDAADVKYIKYEMNKNLLQEGETVGEYIERELVEDELLTATEAKYLFFSNDGQVKRRLFGDANCDGVVDSKDTQLVSQYSANQSAAIDAMTDFGLANSDVDLNGQVTTIDSIIISRHVSAWAGYEKLPYLQ